MATPKLKRGRKKGTTDDTFGAAPRYHQAYLVLGQRLRDGIYPPDVALPTEEELRQEFGVSRVTIRRALAEIEREGLIRRVRGSGTYPVATASAQTPRANISGLYENLATLGLRTRADVLRFEHIPTPLALRQRDERFGNSVLLIVRVRRMGREPFSHMSSYLPESMARHFRKGRLGNAPVLMTLETAGLVAATAEQTLTARAADADTAGVLQVSVGSPLIHMKRLTRDHTGAPLEFFESFYRPDKFEYQMTLSRSRTGEAPKWIPIS